MNENFPAFAKAVYQRLSNLSSRELYTIDGLDLYQTYLQSFPQGSNPVFRVNTEHDCSCCRNFIRNMGGLVAIVDGKKHSIWNVPGLPHPYDVVAERLDEVVTQLPINGVFRTKQPNYGAEVTRERTDTGVRDWHHFHGDVARRHHSNSPDEDRGQKATTAHVLRRGLEELTFDAVNSVLELIEANTLYRGAEFAGAVREFARQQRAYKEAQNPDLYIWSNIDSRAARFRNTAIGTLVQDLSEGVDLERAVRSFETKVAPTNYKRPTALITPRMVDAALKTLADLGLEHAVERRFARISDVAVNDVLFVDNSVKSQMKGGVEGLRAALAGAVKEAAVDIKHAERIKVDDFLRMIMPQAKRIEVLFKNKFQGNLVSLTAPVYPDTGKLFKWKNDFAWSYNGEVTDTIKQRVKNAGGNVEADLRVSLGWSNLDDLDLHCEGPYGHIFYGNKINILDVDMNAGVGQTREPVENLSWAQPRDGVYVIRVNQYSQREMTQVGFSIQIVVGGEVKQYSYGRPVRGTIDCFAFRMVRGVMTELRVTPHLTGGDISTEQWGVKTEAFVPVTTLMTSPNFWDDAGDVGNKHWFFMLEGCKNPDAARGMYNEFLRADLDPHRKVFEVLGSKTKCQPTDNQVSGLGFSSTRSDEVIVKVTTAAFTRAYNIVF